jgi:PAS domain-containing protein
MLPAVDEVTNDLHGHIQGLIKDVIDEPDFVAEFEILNRIDESDAAAYIMDDAYQLLAETNASIARVRTCRTALRQYETKAESVVDTHRERLPIAISVLAVGVSIPALSPVFMWAAWSYYSAALGGFLGFLAGMGMLFAGIASCALVFSLVRRHWEPDKTFGMLGALIAVGISGVIATFLLVWRSWQATYRDAGPFAWLIWAAVVTIVIVLMAVILAQIGDQLERHDLSKQSLLLLQRSSGLLFLAGICGIVAGVTVVVFTAIPGSEAASLAAVAAFMIPLTRATAIPLIYSACYQLKPLFVADLDEQRLMSEDKRLEKELHDAMADWQQAMRVAIRDRLRPWLTKIKTPDFSVELRIVNSDGLLQMHARDSIVATKGVFSPFEIQVSQVNGGAIGVAGPQGVGKSTLLEAYRNGRFIGAGREHLVVFESVPVRYDPRDFALHLYAALCKAVVGFAERHASGQVSMWKQRLIGLLGRLPQPAVILGWLLIGYVGVVLVGGRGLSRYGWAAFAPWVLVAAFGALILWLIDARRTRAMPQDRLASNIATDLPTLSAVARTKLLDIQFQQRHTSGWSGNLSTAFGLGASRSISLERTRQAMSYPELVRDFRDFLAATVEVIAKLDTAAVTPVAIIIDELDKVQMPDQAQEFVNEVKALFGIEVPGSIFLVSVSEEALTSFEQRGLPLRAAFDSTFDIIFRIDYLNLDDTRTLLGNRVVGIGEPFICLCYAFSGGLPREIIRRARTIVGCGETSLTKVAQALVAHDMRAKEKALRTLIGRRAEAEPHSSELIRHLDGYNMLDTGHVLASLQNPPMRRADFQSADKEAHDLFELEIEALCYRYYCATILAVFNNSLTQERLSRGGESDEPSSFSRLADARRLLTVNARVAWFTVTSFRRAWQLEVVEPPWQ